ncbi:MAG TPA: hypothetical protein VFT06_09350, partial [Flavisolibacter sp.]|nr:hypothetical protein [Flavisolibacter sp.]
MKATTQKPKLQSRQGLFHFILSSNTLLAAFLLLFSIAAKANDRPYFESKDYFHWSDVPSGNWNNNNLNKAKSSYAEGDVVAHAFVPNGLSNDGTVYTWILKYDYYLATKNAGGFINLLWDPVQFSKSPGDYFDLTSPLSGAASQTLVPIGTYVSKNISLVSVTQLTDEPGQTTRKVWEIKFTYTGSTGSDAALYFGLQLAKKDDVPGANGAAAWAGASLQTDLGQQSDPGTRSLQIDPGAIRTACETPPT